MSLRITSTGWWGVPGRVPRNVKVHAVCDGKAICGAVFHKDSEYQFCAHGLHRKYIECRACLRLIEQDEMKLEDAEETVHIDKAGIEIRKRVDLAIRLMRKITHDLDKLCKSKK